MGLTPAEGIPEGIPQVMGGSVTVHSLPSPGVRGLRRGGLSQPLPAYPRGKFPPQDMHLKLATQYAPPESPTRGQGGRAGNKNNAAPAFGP